MPPCGRIRDFPIQASLRRIIALIELWPDLNDSDTWAAELPPL
jgi:hypothetical protein